MPTFSLIVPVYKIEDYLPKCIDSVLHQTCQDYELLLVDDGSPDGCGKICDDYAARYPGKIQAIHQPNGGAGAARNTGIARAAGEYLLFLDGDDYLSETLIAELSAAVRENAADLILFGALVEKDGKEIGQLHEDCPSGRVFPVKDVPELYFGVMAPWNRAYRKTLFTDFAIDFPTKIWYEDIRVVTKILAVAQTALRLPGAYYHYLQREGSTMNNTNVERNVEILAAFDDIVGWYREHGFYSNSKAEIEFQAIQHIWLAATVRVLTIDRKHHLIRDFRAYMEEHFPDFAENPYLPKLDSNKMLIHRLLLKGRYSTVRMIFKIKALLGK